MRRAFALFLVLGWFAIACQLIAGIERVEKEDSPPDVVAEPPPPPPPPPIPPDPCSHVRPPPPPAIDDDPQTFIGDASNGDKAGELYFALRDVNLAPGPNDPPLGFDLDGVCTCEKRTPTANDGGPSCRSPGEKPSCDGDGGVDNKLLEVMSQFSGLVDINGSANINARIARGQQNALIIITKYNGRANDKDIGVGIFTSEGIIDDHDGGLGLQPGCPDSGILNGNWTPGWCGTDRWTVSKQTVNQSGPKFEPKLIGVGYVSNYTFVVKFDGTARVPFASYHLTLGGPITTGRLVPLDENQQPRDLSAPGPAPFWRIENGVLGGRFPTSEVLATIGTFALPGGGTDGGEKHICTSPLFSLVLKPAICPANDVNLSTKLDFDPKANCDAISAALGFRADPVVVGDFTDPLPEYNECYPTADGTRPAEAGTATYTCP